MKMEVLAKKGTEQNAIIYLARMRASQKHLVEFVDSVEPGVPREKKWCINVSTQFGCPVNCKFCDAGGNYLGNLTKSEILSQVKYVMEARNYMRTEKLKIHYARMGEPLLNSAVLASLVELPVICKPNTPMACIATTAPVAGFSNLVKIAEIKDSLFPDGFFQLQFSVNSTDEQVRNELMPVKKLTLKELADFGERYWKQSDRKIVLNFALAKNVPVDPDIIGHIFNPDKFVVKITPVNPTENAMKNGIDSMLSYEKEQKIPLVSALRNYGFEVIVSIGAQEEIEIGSNCGQYVKYWNVSQN
jgi:23S rRNA (adenine2503-C2)-methyltransferase